ncbi:hypothetical protein H0H93_001058 [Arthromyces matolae]|nr:hypothetical protein H0H93_001058 [Arthromyces matolae]
MIRSTFQLASAAAQLADPHFLAHLMVSQYCTPRIHPRQEPPQLPRRSSGTTEHATSIPSTSAISQQPADSSSVSSEAYIAEQSVLKEVDTITTSFEKGKITKPDAIGKVITLAYRLKTSELARQAAIIDFIGTIDRVEKRAVTLRDRGKQVETTKDREGHGRSTTVSSSKDRHQENVGFVLGVFDVLGKTRKTEKLSKMQKT